MATKSPMAVAMRASAMPGATVASDTLFIAPMAWKACMMPQTVPKSPMKGAVLEVVASMESEERRRRISSAMPKCRARRTLSLRSLAASPVALMRLNSRTARRVMPKSGERSSSASAPRAWFREGAASMPSMPAAARRLAANRASHLPPMKAQLTSDMKSSKTRTALETRVA